MKTRIVIDKYGNTHYVNAQNKLHRENGPALVLSRGAKAWYRNGLKHRENGPAIELTTGTKEYWINGIQLTEEEFDNRTKSLV